MLPRERVAQVIKHRKPDRIPIYAWLRANLEEEIAQTFGSVEAFEDKYEFDLAHLFGAPRAYPKEQLESARAQYGEITPRQLLQIPMLTPDDMDGYNSIIEGIRKYKENKGRFVYVQTPGIFECLNGVFGIENHLAYLGLYQPELHEIYRRQAQWNRAFALNCIDLGVDMVHVSDDWGSQRGLLFSPKTWWDLIYPYHRITCEAVRKRGCFLSLHSDGNVNAVLDGIIKLGYDVVHPYQESAGMDLVEFKRRFSASFVVMGGLDVQTTLGFGKTAVLKADIERIVGLFSDGGLIFCTSHFVQKHCTMAELAFAFDTAYGVSRNVCKT